MKCPLCQTRKAKRHCPAKSAQICAVCCATQREIEIDCPIDCPHLREGYNYAEERGVLDQRAKEHLDEKQFDRSFLVANEFFLMELWGKIWDCYQAHPQIHDSDILEALEALEKTFQTLDKGLYYDSKPEGSLPQILYDDLKKAIDEKIKNPDLNQHHLKVSTALDCLAFLQQFARLKGSGRPLSRGFLLQIEEAFAHLPSTTSDEEPRIVLS